MKKSFHLFSIFLISVLLSLFFLHPIVHSQENDTEIEINSSNLSISDQVIRKERLEAEIKDQHSQLLSQLSTYQNDERNFRVAHDQYLRLQTLNSIEGVIASAKNLNLSRNKALHSYLNLLRLKIIEAEGIEMFHKERVLERILSLQGQLDDHSKQVESIVAREEINDLAETFKPISLSITETSYYALSVLTVGKLQAVYDQSAVVGQRIFNEESNTVLAESTNRTRSLAEVDKLMSELPPLFQEIWAEVNHAEGKTQGYRNLYSGLSRKLNTTYSKLSRLVAYFEEIENVK